MKAPFSNQIGNLLCSDNCCQRYEYR